MKTNSLSCEPISIFDRPLHLAGILDNAADELSSMWLGYNWSDRTRCNCGIVASQVLQSSPARLKKLLPPIYESGHFRPTWRVMTETYCSDSGLPQNEVFSRMLASGFRYEDFCHLEELSNEDVLSRMISFRRTKKPVLKSRRSDVVAYLRAWAEGIEAFRDEDANISMPTYIIYDNLWFKNILVEQCKLVVSQPKIL